MSTMPTAIAESSRAFFRNTASSGPSGGCTSGSSRTRLGRLLNRHGAHAFGLIEDLLAKDMILCVTRMMNTSKASWGDPANLATLLIDLTAHKQMALVKRLTAIRDRVEPVAEGLKRWREERLSGNDYAAYVGMKADAAPCPRMSERWSRTSSQRWADHKAGPGHYSGVAEMPEDVAPPGDFNELVGHLRELDASGRDRAMNRASNPTFGGQRPAPRPVIGSRPSAEPEGRGVTGPGLCGPRRAGRSGAAAPSRPGGGRAPAGEPRPCERP